MSLLRILHLLCLSGPVLLLLAAIGHLTHGHASTAFSLFASSLACFCFWVLGKP